MAKRKRTAAVAEKGLNLSANNSTLRINFEKQQAIDKPAEFVRIVERARYFSNEIEWLQTFLPMKLSVFNYGLELVAGASAGKDATDAQSEALARWLDSKNSIEFEPYKDPNTEQVTQPELFATNRELIETFIEDCWREFLLLDNLVVMWLDENKYASILPPERCLYSDLLGIPVMKFIHGLSSIQILLLPPDQQELFKRWTSILLSPKQGQHFKVLKRSRIGEGFTKPTINAIFRLLGEVESKQIGMNALAFAMRKMTRWHKIGHSIDGGERAGLPRHFYTKIRADAIKKLWVDVTGVDDYVSNFDETIEWPWPPKELFSDAYFGSSIRRLEDWGGPLAIMLRATAQMPYLMPLLKAQALKDRAKMGQFLMQTINEAYDPPVPIRIGWSNLIFNEARLSMEMLKFASMSGIGSNTTIASEVGLDPAKEAALKMKEANDPDHLKKYTPIWDAQHGLNPLEQPKAPKGQSKTSGQAPAAQPGRPPGATTAR